MAKRRTALKLELLEDRCVPSTAPVAVDESYTLNEDQTLTVAPTPGVTSLTMDSEAGDWIGQGESYSFTPATGTFGATRNFDNGVNVNYSGAGSWWNLRFAAPGEVTLTPGVYNNATRWPFQAPTAPGLDVSGEGRGSNTLTGHFNVTQALYAANGDVLRFAATFEQHSEGSAPALTGEVKYNQGDGPSGILLNDTDADGDPLTIIVVAGPSHGTLAMNIDGSFKYTPQANYNGSDSFTYKVSDGVNESNVGTVSLTVNPVNDFPTASNDTYFGTEDNVLTVSAPGVLANDSDIDSPSLTATLVTSTTKGALVLNANGSFTYTPNANYNGNDTFQYAAHDGTSFSFIRTVTLIVTSVNDAPVAAGDSYSVAEDNTLTVAALGVLANDSDVEGTTLSAILDSGVAHGTLNLSSNGSFTYTPHANYHGPDSFTYHSRDASLNSDVVTVSLEVTSVNDAPLVNAGADDSTNEGGTLTFNGSASDVEGGPLSYSWDFGGGNTVSGATVNYTFNDSGTYQVTLTVSDGVNSSTDTLQVVVSNIPPIAFVSGPNNGVRGQPRPFILSTMDLSPVDAASSFTYSINWGDGSAIQTANGLSSHEVSHVFVNSGSYTVSVSATDKDGAVSSTVLHFITIAAVQVQGVDLAVGGTTGNDNITLKVADTGGGVKVTFGSAVQGTFNITGRILVHAQAGTDSVKFVSTKFSGVVHYIQDKAVVFGDNGNDTIDARGSNVANILVGGNNNDTIYGGRARDIIIGGAGADTLRGGLGEDVLIGNGTTFGANLAALYALMAEWSRSDLDYNARTDHLRGVAPGGLNGDTFLNASTIPNDAAIDQLYGEAGLDLFFFTSTGTTKDVVKDFVTGERKIAL